ncbi:MAG: hypothetical protein KUG58_06210 [Marinosulfonomonas sp.]|nr:hypothetical protein [Marinosulfonomonas sp.]
MLDGQSRLTYLIWATLLVALAVAILLGRWSLGFVALATLVASMAPLLVARRFNVYVPLPFLSAIVVFIFASLFLGEAFDFYERYWWWDVLLHGGAAVGFGLVGFVFVFYLFEGDRYAAPAWAIAFVSFCFAVAIGTGWELFEYTMDLVFGMAMQKSGLDDTMLDLVADAIGAFIGAAAGFGYLKGRQTGGLPRLIGEFVRKNRAGFKKSGRKDP